MTVGGVSMQWREGNNYIAERYGGGEVSGADCMGPSAGLERPPQDDKRQDDERREITSFPGGGFLR